MGRIAVMPVRRGADCTMAGVPDDLAEKALVLVVLEAGGQDGERLEAGDVVLLGEGKGYGVYRAGRGAFELRREDGQAGEGRVAQGDVMGILKKFKV